jgi:hypothetical protein
MATMVAGLLYVIGLISVLITIAVAGFNIPTTINQVTTAMDSGNADYMSIARTIMAAYGWIAVPFIGGLLLMGAGRVIMLLGAINRSLRGQS